MRFSLGSILLALAALSASFYIASATSAASPLPPSTSLGSLTTLERQVIAHLRSQPGRFFKIDWDVSPHDAYDDDDSDHEYYFDRDSPDVIANRASASRFPAGAPAAISDCERMGTCSPFSGMLSGGSLPYRGQPMNDERWAQFIAEFRAALSAIGKDKDYPRMADTVRTELDVFLSRATDQLATFWPAAARRGSLNQLYALFDKYQPSQLPPESLSADSLMDISPREAVWLAARCLRSGMHNYTENAEMKEKFPRFVQSIKKAKEAIQKEKERYEKEVRSAAPAAPAGTATATAAAPAASAAAGGAPYYAGEDIFFPSASASPSYAAASARPPTPRSGSASRIFPPRPPTPPGPPAPTPADSVYWPSRPAPAPAPVRPGAIDVSRAFIY